MPPLWSLENHVKFTFGVLRSVAKVESQMRGSKGFCKLTVSTKNTLIKDNASGRSGPDQPVRPFSKSELCLHSTNLGGGGVVPEEAL